MTLTLPPSLLQAILNCGVVEFCICPGSRNAPLIPPLLETPFLTHTCWYEERSAAFFALGRARATGRPVAVLTTSGTAAGELLPAVMEAYYTGTPLLLITADRPRRFRGTGAPQSCEQVGLFGCYTPFSQDIEGDELCRLSEWNQTDPAHLNICLEDPKHYASSPIPLHKGPFIPLKNPISPSSLRLDDFFTRSNFPFVIVSTLRPDERPAVINFLLRLKAPIYCESGSGLREEPRLSHLSFKGESTFLTLSRENGYPIDGILRIGGIPVTRLWRDLEEAPHSFAQCSLSELPFSGLSWGNHIQCSLSQFLSDYPISKNYSPNTFSSWQEADREWERQLQSLFEEESQAEPSLFHVLSQQIPDHALVYLGNSLPVREWDLAAVRTQRGFQIETSRGLNGIDGQISTFLGLCRPDRENWAILGDLTTLYDFAALWILNALTDRTIRIIVINNSGGKIFSRIHKDPIFQNCHSYGFEHFAKSWDLEYLHTESMPLPATLPRHVLIELCPDLSATERFWEAYDKITINPLTMSVS